MPLNKSHSSSFRSSDGKVQRRQERKVTVIVCAIVCCFILTQGPSCALMMWNFFFNEFKEIKDPVLYEISRAGNFLTTIGKSSNFFLFCFISSSFRLRLLALLAEQQERSSIFSHCYRFRRRTASMASNSIIPRTRASSSTNLMSGRSRASLCLVNNSKNVGNATMAIIEE